METRPDDPPVSVESVRVLLGACLSLLDTLKLHQAAAYVDMALHHTGAGAPVVPPPEPPAG